MVSFHDIVLSNTRFIAYSIQETLTITILVDDNFLGYKGISYSIWQRSKFAFRRWPVGRVTRRMKGRRRQWRCAKFAGAFWSSTTRNNVSTSIFSASSTSDSLKLKPPSKNLRSFLWIVLRNIFFGYYLIEIEWVCIYPLTRKYWISNKAIFYAKVVNCIYKPCSLFWFILFVSQRW